MSLAYLILAHKNPPQFSRLLEAIYDRDNFYAVHVDKKSPRAVHQAIAESARRYSNVRIVRPRSIHWGGWSMVQATLDGIELLLKMGRWQNFLNLSGQDYPLKNQRQIQQILASQTDKNFIECKVVEEAHRLARLNYVHVELPTRVYRLPIRRNIQRRWIPYWGSQWITISQAFAQFAASKDTSAMRRYFRHTAIPDESFFQTLAMNSPFRESIVANNGRWIEWERDSTGQIGHHPRTLEAEDLPRVLASDCLFARKFEDEAVIGAVERSGRNPTA